MVDLITRGGIMMYPIIAASVIALAIILEKFYLLFFQAKYPCSETRTRLFDLFRGGSSGEVKEMLTEEAALFADYFLSILRETEKTEMENAASRTGEMIIFTLTRRLSILSVIASVLPLMGLLGTVLGMIKVFSRVAQAGNVTDIAVLAGGIWEALITTAAGMAIAIPVLLIHHYLKRHISGTAYLMQQDGNFLISLSKEKGTADDTL